MAVQRFIGSNARDAMRQVRTALGDDALILSNRPVESGVEIVAMPENEHARSLAQLESPVSESSPALGPSPAAPPVAPASSETLELMQSMNRQLLEEVRAMLQAQTAPGADISVRERRRTALRRRLVNAGFSTALAGELLTGLPDELLADGDTAGDAPAEALMAWLTRQIAGRLTVLEDESELFEAAGVMALVGPTGVGKTTTTAKLAARYVMRHGPKEAALVTTDSYRIGAAEQLRIYAKLLGVEVHALDAEGDLGALLGRLAQPRRALLSKLAGKRMVVIDTVGMSQRDQRLMGEIARFGASPVATQRLLVLDAASHGDTLEQVVAAWQRASIAAGAPLWGCIITKLDEAARPGTVLDVVIRHRLRLCYVSRGQRVPEDFECADGEALVREALALDQGSPFAFDEADLASDPQAGRHQALSRDVLREGRALAHTLATLRSHNLGMTLLEQSWQQARAGDEPARSGFARLMAVTTQQAMLHASGTAHALWWSKPTPVGSSQQAMPLVTLDEHGLPQPLVWPRHRLPTGNGERLAWAESLGVRWHLLTRLPGIAELARVEAVHRAWLAPVTAAKRLQHAGERQPLSTLAALAEPLEPSHMRHQGRRARLELARLDVLLTERGSANGLPVIAWFAVLIDPDDGRVLARRYWLGTAGAGRDSRSRLVCALSLEALPALTRRAGELLKARGMAGVDREQRWQLAAAVAALALRLAMDDADWAMDVRAHLSQLVGKRCGRRSTALLEAVMAALGASEALSGAVAASTSAAPD